MTGKLFASKWSQTVESAMDVGNCCTGTSVTDIYDCYAYNGWIYLGGFTQKLH